MFDYTQTHTQSKDESRRGGFRVQGLGFRVGGERETLAILAAGAMCFFMRFWKSIWVGAL